MNQTLVYPDPARVGTRVRSAGGKYQVNSWKVGVACFSVGDRFQSKWDKSIISTLVKIRQSGKKPYTLQHDNGRKVHCDESWLLGMKFLEDEERCYYWTLD